MASPLKIAILGCEHCHVRGFARLVRSRTDLDVVEIWGRDTAVTGQFASDLAAKMLTAPEDMSAVDLAVILSDTRDHGWLLGCAVGKAGAVHMDKPLGLDTDDAAALATAAAPLGDRFSLGFFARHNPLVQELKRRIDAGEIGALTHLSLTFGHAGMLEDWLRDWPALMDRSRMGYGSFGDLGSHMIDLAWLLAGELTPKACTLQYRPGIEMDVGGAALAQTASGALVRLYASTAMQGPRFELRADGETGSLWFRGKALGRYCENDEPEVLMRGDWSEASDAPAALIAKIQGEAHCPIAGTVDGLRVNRLLDAFEKLAGAR